LDEALDYRYHLQVLLEGHHLFSFHCTLILYAVELIVNCHQLDIGTGWTKSRHCTLTASAADWVTIQRGELDRFNAWTGGKLKVDGDKTLVLQLEETISKLSR
jgi:hypothetical protein